MELEILESKKALALEAFVGGQYAQAEQIYRELDAEYDRYQQDEGRLALLFNRLLVSLEDGARSRTLELMGEIADGLREQGNTAIGREVAGRLCALFSEPLSGADHEASTALVTLAGELAGHLYIEPDRRIQITELPGPNDYLHLGPTESAVRVLALADALRGHPKCPGWIRNVQTLFDWSLGPGDSFADAMEHYRQRLASGDLLKAYRALVEALQLSSVEHMPTAFQLLIGLGLLEAEGLDRKLGYASDPPQERCLALSAELFQRLSEKVSESPAARRLGRHFAHAVVESSMRLDSVIQQRVERGSQQARDADILTRNATVRARALTRLGQFENALDTLAGFLSKAERGTLRDSTVAMHCLFEHARIAELIGSVRTAYQGYLAAVRFAIPQFMSARNELVRGDAVYDVSDDEHRILCAIRALAGAARIVGEADGHTHIERARFIIDVAGPTLRGDSLAAAHLETEMSATFIGQPNLALRALEAARVLEDRGSIAVCYIYWARALYSTDTESSREKAMTLLGEAARETRALPNDQLRHHIDLWLASCMMDMVENEERASYEVLLRRVAEDMSVMPDSFGRHDFQCIAEPMHALIETVVSRLLDGFGPALAQRLCAGWTARSYRGLTTLQATSVPLSQYLKEEFEAVWVRTERSGFDNWRLDLRSPISDRNSLNQLRSFDREHILIEFAIFSGWSVCFIRQDRSLESIRLPLGAAELGELMNAAEPDYALLEAFFMPINCGIDRMTLVSMPCGYEGLIRLWSLYLDTHERQVKRKPVGIPPIAQLPFPLPSVMPPAALVIAGDDATAQDLRLSQRAGIESYSHVSTIHGEGLSPSVFADGLKRGRMVCLVGAVTGEGINLRDESRSFLFTELRDMLSHAGSSLVVVMGPVAQSYLESMLPTLLGGVQAGVLVKTGPGDDRREFLGSFLKEAAGAEGPMGLLDAYQRVVDLLEDTSESRVYQLYLKHTS